MKRRRLLKARKLLKRDLNYGLDLVPKSFYKDSFLGYYEVKPDTSDFSDEGLFLLKNNYLFRYL